MLRNSLHDHHIGQRGDHSGARPTPLTSDHQALSAVFIDQVQHPYGASIVRPGADEIVAPYVAHTLRPEAYARPIVEPQPPSWLLLLRYFQPFATPDSLDPIFTYSPAGSLQQRRDPPIPIAAILAGQYDDGLGESIFVFSLCRLIALRAPWLVYQLARTALATSSSLRA